MAQVETGFFLLVLSFAFGFTFMQFKTIGKAKAVLQIMGLALFLVVSVWMTGGYEVSASSTNLTYNATNDLIFNETKNDTFIPGGTETSWIGYLFMGLGMMNLILFVRDMMGSQ